ncbi:hypothetical protein [Schaalia sp. lx-100]|uniref:hypothetical protein n=1 Tax=Schaalia sp. lx-100 TaxID=2899081 RepID=UPI001E307049|nr:hypothetical protein [Schaalia sp. lx-100]MCD4557335.1 hypothetical protein [Schaalia sp. lx-100]
MNQATVNRIIDALNQISQASFTIAQTLSEQAWENFEDHAGMPGTRPAEATTPNQPTQTNSQGEALPVEDPPGYISLEDARAVLADLSRTGFTTQIKELLASFGAEKLSEVPEADLGVLVDKAREVTGHAAR